MKEKNLELKSLREATEQEKKEIIKTMWQSIEMQKHCLDKYDYYITSDGYFLEIEKFKKIRIIKTIYYNDEYEAPENNFENFYNCNKCDLRYDLLKFIHEYGTDIFYFIKGDNNEVYVGTKKSFDVKKCNDELRTITNDELSDILQIYKLQKENYIERLKKYYNRYRCKITVYGYWANR